MLGVYGEIGERYAGGMDPNIWAGPQFDRNKLINPLSSLLFNRNYNYRYLYHWICESKHFDKYNFFFHCRY